MDFVILPLFSLKGQGVCMCEVLTPVVSESLQPHMDCGPQALYSLILRQEYQVANNALARFILSRTYSLNLKPWTANSSQVKYCSYKYGEKLRKGMKWKWPSRVQLCSPWTICSWSSPGQNTEWSSLPTSRVFPTLGIEPQVSCINGSLPAEPQRKSR